MAENHKQATKMPSIATKSFMAIGPTLHYSHRNVQRCWLLAIVAFSLSCFFWSRIVTGSFWSFDLQEASSFEHWRLDRFILTGVSIFEYPWQILVLGLLMGIFATVPVLISQLMSFGYSFVFVLAVCFLADLPGFALCLLASCIAAACRPLRFRSRFVAIVLCTAPQLLYWGYFGGTWKLEPIILGFSFAPWVCAWLIGLGVAGLVLGIGHFTRYRPGLTWIVTSVFFLLAIITFEVRIGFDELDYQLYVAKNNPERISEFQEHSLTEALDRTITDPGAQKYFAGFFYPTEPIPLRAELKKEMQIQLSYDSWPAGFIVPEELRYQEKRQWLNQQYKLFINPPKPWWMPTVIYTEWIKKRSSSKRMPIALYYDALLSEYSPDIGLVGQKEVLRFYSDYPYERSREIWYRLYRGFGGSLESLEARWRIAKHWAGQGMVEQADALLAEAQTALREQLKLVNEEKTQGDTLFSPFHPPADSAMTAVKLTELQKRINQLRSLIGTENQKGQAGSGERLAEFVMLNPHSLDYGRRLSLLLEQTGPKDGLRDNILLAQAKLIADEQQRAEQLGALHKEFQDTDGGMQALYELGLLKRRQWSQQDDSNLELKKKLLGETRALFTSFITLYPNSFYAEQVKKNLEDLPKVE
jgi:hypothetical protein